jgi:hypothetical protein
LRIATGVVGSSLPKLSQFGAVAAKMKGSFSR